MNRFHLTLTGTRAGALAMGLLLAAPAWAENPRISLRLEKVTAAEAIARLAEVTRVKVGLYAPPGQAQPGLPILQERADFDWNRATLGRAMRDLAKRYELRPNREPGGGYMLFPAFGLPAPPPGKAVGVVEQNGAKLFARSVQVYETRTANFADEGQNFASGNLVLQAGCILAEGDAEAIAGFRNLSGMDDLGNLLLPDNDGLQAGGGVSGGFPDEWQGAFSLRAPSLAAKKLAWVEGDLLVYREFKARRLEIPFPTDGKPVRREVGDVTVVLFQLPPDPVDEPAPDLAGIPVEAPLQQPWRPQVHFRLRIYAPSLTRVRARGGEAWNVQPLVLGAKGQPVFPRRMQVEMRGVADGRLGTSVFSCAADEQPTTLVLEFVETGEPELLTHFRMKEIPLPAGGGQPGGRRPTPPAPLPAPAPGAERPYHQPGGAMLSSPVELRGKPAAPGTLSFGLARKEGDHFASIRWIQREVSADGLARLEDLQPGTYRILRAYRPTNAADRVPGAGRWQAAELTLTVTAGKETALPPLRWLAEPAVRGR